MSAACPVVRDWNAVKVSKGTIEGLLRTNVPVVNIGVLDEPKLELVPVNSPGVLITQTYDDPLSDVNPEIALGTDQYPAWCDLFVKAIFRVEGKSRDEGIYHMGAIYKWWGSSKYVYVPKKQQQLKGKNTPAVVAQERGASFSLLCMHHVIILTTDTTDSCQDQQTPTAEGQNDQHQSSIIIVAVTTTTIIIIMTIRILFIIIVIITPTELETVEGD